MSEMITTTGHKNDRGVKKSNKLSTRVDLTPMVDLGFLLITFFIFTTTMSQPTAMRLLLPKDSGDSTRVPASGALTLLLGKNDIVYYYEGELIPGTSGLKFTSYPGMRELIINKKKTTNSKDFVVVIKPQEESVFRNVVNTLDEMTINGVGHYAVVDISPLENRLIYLTEKESVK